jgi:hypothetical protein|tara:strand:- start:185 stop:370 length:186 start_codon:yes stop_codon:yes gene_type:complete
MSDKEKKIEKEISSSPFEDEKPFLKKGKPVAGKLNDPKVSMRRKNKICRDGRDWFDTHPDA